MANGAAFDGKEDDVADDPEDTEEPEEEDELLFSF
jgi:hypothetical protein